MIDTNTSPTKIVFREIGRQLTQGLYASGRMIRAGAEFLATRILENKARREAEEIRVLYIARKLVHYRYLIEMGPKFDDLGIYAFQPTAGDFKAARELDKRMRFSGRQLMGRDVNSGNIGEIMVIGYPSDFANNAPLGPDNRSSGNSSGRRPPRDLAV